jgi:hypothetical protein
MASIRDSYEKNIGDIISEIKLARHSNLGKDIVFVLVEGIDDVKLYSKLFLEDNITLRSTEGKNNIYKALKELTGTTKQFIAIKDADFDHLNKKNPEYEALFFTDKHDIEMTMLAYPEAVRSVLAEYLLPEKSDERVREAMQGVAYLSYIRWFNEVEKCGLDCKGIIHSVKEGMTNAELIALVKSRSKSECREVSQTEIDDFIEKNKTDDYFNLCNGHDVIVCMAITISKESEKTSEGKLAKDLRLSFSNEYFLHTTLYSNILAWQKKNGFNILYTKQTKQEGAA